MLSSYLHELCIHFNIFKIYLYIFKLYAYLFVITERIYIYTALLHLHCNERKSRYFVNISGACASNVSPSNDEWSEVMTNYYSRYIMNHTASVYREE